jgi:guanylate kinase
MKMKKRKGNLIVLSAPSGAGKSTLCSALMRDLDSITYSISCTTRPRRSGEKEGVDYCFVDEARFRTMVTAGKFAEWACVHDYYYGTPHAWLKKTIAAGTDVLLDIDVQGGLKIKELYPDAVMIFIMAPSFDVLEQRLRSRNKDTDAVIMKRLANARKEVKKLPLYTYLVINDTIAVAAKELRMIVQAERMKICRGSIPAF